MYSHKQRIVTRPRVLFYSIFPDIPDDVCDKNQRTNSGIDTLTSQPHHCCSNPWVFVVRFWQKVMNMAYAIAEHHFHSPFFVRRNLHIPIRFLNLIVPRASENEDGYSD